MPEFKSSLQAVWWVVEHRVRAEELSQNSVAAFSKPRKVIPFFWQNISRLTSHTKIQQEYVFFLKKKKHIEHFYFRLRTFQGAAQSRIF